MRPLLLAAGLVAGVTVGAYLGARPRLLRYGATDDEVARPIPSDDLVSEPTYLTNRAITIEAPPEAVWPWLAQMGELPRGGFYSFEWIERLLGMKIENADRILEDYQDIRKGDVLDHSGTMTVLDVVSEHWIALGPPPGKVQGLATVWTLALYPDDFGRTRLLSRVRARVGKMSPAGAAMMMLMDPGQLIMELKMFSELKKRAERPETETAAA